MYASAHNITIINVNHQLMCTYSFQLSWFTWTLLMAYPRPNSKSNYN